MRNAYLPLMLVFGVLTGCDSSSGKSTSTPTHSHPRSGLVNLSGPAANQLLDAMENSGVLDTDRLLGAKNIKAQTITCQRAIGPRRHPECSVILETQEVLTPSMKDAASLYQILLDAGGLFFTGEPDIIGVLADDVTCTRPVVPQPETRCRFLINVRNPSHLL